MPRVLGIAHQRARILLRKTRSKILCSPKDSHFAPQNKEDYEMENETKLCKHCKSDTERREGLPKLQKETGRYREMDRDRCGGGYYYCSNVGRWSG